MANIPSNVRPDYRPIGADGTWHKADSANVEGTSWGYLCQGQVHNLQPNYCNVTPSAVLVGAGFYNPVFGYTYNEGFSTGYIVSDTYGEEQMDTTFSHNWAGTGIFYNNTFNAYEGFTIRAISNYGCGTSISGFQIRWYQNIHYGVAQTGSTLNSVFISGTLTNKFLTGTKAITFTITANSGEYIWYAYRVDAGTPNFSVNDFNGGFQIASTGTSFTNASGFTEQYQIWRSDYPSLGAITVVVT